MESLLKMGFFRGFFGPQNLITWGPSGPGVRGPSGPVWGTQEFRRHPIKNSALFGWPVSYNDPRKKRYLGMMIMIHFHPFSHQNLNVTWTQRTPFRKLQSSCNRYSGWGVDTQWVLLEISWNVGFLKSWCFFSVFQAGSERSKLPCKMLTFLGGLWQLNFADFLCWQKVANVKSYRCVWATKKNLGCA